MRCLNLPVNDSLSVSLAGKAELPPGMHPMLACWMRYPEWSLPLAEESAQLIPQGGVSTCFGPLVPGYLRVETVNGVPQAPGWRLRLPGLLP